MFASSADADVALRAFASAASDARARTRYARSLPAPAVSALLRRLRAPSVSDALPALALLWAGRLPRTELIGALLRSPAADALACEMDVLCRSADTLRDLAAVAAASARSGSPHAERVLLASARALQRRPEPRSAGVAARVVAVAVDRLVVRGSSPAEGVLALADAGFAPAAAPAACVRAEGASSVEPDLFHVLLLLIPRVPPPDRRLLASAALSHAASASGAAARAVLLAAQSAFSEPAAADATLSVLEAALSSDTPARQLGPVDVALAYALLSHSPSKSRALALLRSLHAATDDRFAAGMPGPSSAPRVPRASRALTSALALPGFGPSAHVAADLLDALARARVPDVSGAMTALFRSQPPARPRLLGHLFGSLADAGGRTPSSAYIRLLHKLTSSADASALLRPHADVLAGWLASLPSMPFDAAVAVVRALASVAPTLPSLGDRLLGSVRKLAGARARVPRALALHALAALAGAPGVSAALSEEVSSLLSAALARPGAAPALSLLARSARSSPGGRWGPLASAALDLLGRPTALRLDDCFDPHSATPSPLREAAPALAFLLVAAPASPFAAATASALSDPRRSLVDACASPDARATYARASMLARLCEELVASGRVASVLPVYALVFVVRDAVPAQMRVRPAGGQAAVLASVSARERSAHESLAESAEFARLEGAGAVSGECALELADCLRVLSGLGEVEAGVGRFAASVLHAEVLARLVGEYRPVGAAGDGDNELGPAVRAAAANAFMATSPSLSDTPAPTSVADGQTKAPRRTPRRSGAKRPRPPRAQRALAAPYQKRARNRADPDLREGAARLARVQQQHERHTKHLRRRDLGRVRRG